ncbi:single-stranded DNA-binding protein [Acinetobacter pittii]|uniref:ERF family protein n=1 Tax=Acinetobacter pittii TaxID=48296 RepID=UPI000C195DAC|nr:ERF family protein [Acinetobacter pittii]PIL90745.1 single-stranded DNA-binding protein [Acinetobacter pittii]
MNAAINSDVLGNATAVNPLDLPGLEQVFHHPTFIKVINELKAPKSHTNEFGGGYKYRSAEDIQEALKPLLVKYKCTVITRKFDTADGFEIYAYMVFKDQKYIRCDVPGEAKHDFDRDLSSNKKVSKTQQNASYQSYAKKYALGNLLMIDDSQNDLDTHTNENIKRENQSRNNQNYHNQRSNYVPTQADCDKALKQIKELSLDTTLSQAEYFFNGIRNQLPEFDEVLFAACNNKYNEIVQHLENLNQQQLQTANRSAETVRSQPGYVPITDKQLIEIRAFISERALDITQVCEHLGIDGLAQIGIAQFEEAKQHIDKLAKQEIKA